MFYTKLNIKSDVLIASKGAHPIDRAQIPMPEFAVASSQKVAQEIANLLGMEVPLTSWKWNDENWESEKVLISQVFWTALTR